MTKSSDSNQLKKAKMVAWKNTLFNGLAVFLHFTGLIPIINVQSSLNNAQGLGTVALSVYTSCGILTSMLLTTYVIRKLGCKWTIVLGQLASTVYIAANFYPIWATLVPAAVLGGAGRSLMVIGQTTYLNRLTKWYAVQLDTDVSNVSPRFFGVFFAMMYSCDIFGNLASSFILGLKTLSIDDHFNQTVAYDVLQTCGAQYCNEDLGTGFNWKSSSSIGNGTEDLSRTSGADSRTPERWRVYALCGFCLISVVLSSILLALLLDDLSKLIRDDDSDRKEKSPLRLVVATFTNLRNPLQLLLLPLTFYNGVDNYFFGADFTKAFITCPLGIQYIGVVTASAGVFSLVSSFAGGWFHTRKTRWVPNALAALTHLIPAIVMLHWIPSQNETMIQYILASSWGTGCGLYAPQIFAYYGIIFAKNLETAMASCVLWQSVASVTLYGLSHLLCVYVKISILIGLLVAGMFGFAAVEIWTIIKDDRLKKVQAKESLALTPIKKGPDTIME